jgi:hypothetical protein
MESGVRVYNVDPLVEKAHFGKFIVIKLLDQNYECLVNSVHTWKNSTDLLNVYLQRKRCEIINTFFMLKEGVCEVQNLQNVLWVTRMLAVNTSTCQLCT